MDTIGPWEMTIGNDQVKFSALTIINTATNLVKLVCLDNCQRNINTSSFNTLQKRLLRQSIRSSQYVVPVVFDF